MDDLHGSAQERLTQLDAAVSRGASPEWLEKHLRATLEELADIDRREDY